MLLVNLRINPITYTKASANINPTTALRFSFFISFNFCNQDRIRTCMVDIFLYCKKCVELSYACKTYFNLKTNKYASTIPPPDYLIFYHSLSYNIRTLFQISKLSMQKIYFIIVKLTTTTPELVLDID